MNTKLFRKVAIERLSSPEQLDLVLRVTSYKIWLALIAIFAVLGVTCVWGFTGSIPTSSAGEGLIVRRGGVTNVVSQSGGVILEIRAKPGDHIQQNQVIATVAQPLLAEKLRELRAALDEAQRRRAQNLQIQQDSANLQLTALEGQRASINLQIRQLEDKEGATTDQIHSEEQLLAKGLVTKQQVIAIQHSLAGLKEQVEGLRAQLKQLDSQAFNIKSGPAQSDAPMQANIASIERELAGAKQEASRAEVVVSHFSGEVLELKVYAGSAVTPGQPLLSIQPNDAALEVVAYLPAAHSKDTRPGLEVQVSPMNIKREEYGFLIGEVTYVADYPATPEALMRNFENRTLVDALSNSGPVTEIHASLRGNPRTFSGFQWSTSEGPPMKITSGTICSVQIVTERQKPASLVFPYLKKKLGLS
jgi:HlyD family secretion protein